MAIDNNSKYTLTGAQIIDITSRIKNIGDIANAALPNTTNYAANLTASLNTSDYKLTLGLLDQHGNVLGTNKVVDLPLESTVVGGSYNSTTKNVILELQSGSNIEFSVADLVSGLQSEINATNPLDAAYINTDASNLFVNQAEKTKLDSILNITNVEAPLYFNTTTNNLWLNTSAIEYNLPIATTTNLGGIKVGDGLAINATTGVLSANMQAEVISSSDWTNLWS
ncbi:hypothetical protein IJG14_01690 [bacterium]|nr:hypothetical protein [bacterium]